MLYHCLFLMSFEKRVVWSWNNTWKENNSFVTILKHLILFNYFFSNSSTLLLWSRIKICTVTLLYKSLIKNIIYFANFMKGSLTCVYMSQRVIWHTGNATKPENPAYWQNYGGDFVTKGGKSSQTARIIPSLNRPQRHSFFVFCFKYGLR